MELDAKYMNSMMKLARRLPPEVIYSCGLIAFGHSTTGKHSGTDTKTVSGIEILSRYLTDKITPLEALVKGPKDDGKG